MFGNVLVATDGSERSQCAVEAAVSFAAETGATLTFLNVRQRHPFLLSPETGLTDAIASANVEHEAQRYARALVDAAAEKARAAGVGATSVTVASGAPYRGIMDVAEQRGCDLIFMASHGRRGIGAILLGSEVQKVLTNSRIPVLVWR